MRAFLTLLVVTMLLSGCGSEPVFTEQQMSRIAWAIETATTVQERYQERTPWTTQAAAKMIEDIRPIVESCMDSLPEAQRQPFIEPVAEWRKGCARISRFQPGTQIPMYQTMLDELLNQSLSLLNDFQEIGTHGARPN